MSAFATHPLYGSLHATSLIALVVPVDTSPGYGASFTYDADPQLLSIRFDPGLEPDTEYPSFTLRHSSRVTGSYIGSNAFNAHARITKYHDENYGVAFPAQTHGSLDNTSPISMSPELARRHKPGLRLLLICEPISP